MVLETSGPKEGVAGEAAWPQCENQPVVTRKPTNKEGRMDAVETEVVQVPESH
jgi:hypothetical protein